jgi:hypothetical protein
MLLVRRYLGGWQGRLVCRFLDAGMTGRSTRWQYPFFREEMA